MKDRKKLALPTVIRVDSLNSLYRFDLGGMDPRGDIHDFYELLYVEEGHFSVLVDGILHTVPAGSLFFYAPNSYHIGSAEHPSDALVSILSFDSASPAMRWFDNRVVTPTDREREELLSLFSLARSLTRPAPPLGLEAADEAPPHRLQLLANRLEHLLLSLYREEESPQRVSGRRAYKKEQFLALSHYLKQHLAERHTLCSIAEATATSVSSVKALCREFCAAGPNEYLISLRIGRARELIREGAMTFTEIAEVTGFGTIHYFSRIFKAHTGQTPTQYAAMVAEYR